MDDVAKNVLAETWDADGDTISLVAPDDRGAGSMVVEVVGRMYCLDGCPEVARTRLAACAPEALRLLLEAEASDNSDGEYTPRCPWCENRAFSVDVPGETGRRFVSYHPSHAPGCKWLALMVKAGVR